MPHQIEPGVSRIIVDRESAYPGLVALVAPETAFRRPRWGDSSGPQPKEPCGSAFGLRSIRNGTDTRRLERSFRWILWIELGCRTRRSHITEEG